MHDATFDSMTQHAATALSRRRSLLTLGGVGAAMAALGVPSPASAGKANKKARRKVRKTRKKQKRQCKQSVQDYCDGPFPILSDPEDCRERLLPCCDDFATCDAAAGAACLLGPFLAL